MTLSTRMSPFHEHLTYVHMHEFNSSKLHHHKSTIYHYTFSLPNMSIRSFHPIHLTPAHHHTDPPSPRPQCQSSFVTLFLDMRCVSSPRVGSCNMRRKRTPRYGSSISIGTRPRIWPCMATQTTKHPKRSKGVRVPQSAKRKAMAMAMATSVKPLDQKHLPHHALGMQSTN